MARVTQVQPWGFGGKQSGDFSGRTAIIRPSLVTRYTAFGFGGKRNGSFVPRGLVVRTGPYTDETPFGFGGKRYGSFAGRDVIDPASSGSGNFSLSGTNYAKLGVGDAGGPYYEHGEFRINGVGSGVVNVGFRVGTGSGSFTFNGSGLGVILGSGEQVATGSGSFGLSGTGVGTGPFRVGISSGSFGLSGSGAALSEDLLVGDATLSQIAAAVLESEIEPGISLKMAMRAALAVMGGPAESLSTGSEERFKSPAGVTRVRSRVDAAGNRLVELSLR